MDKLISSLESKFEDLKEKFSKEEIIYLFAQFEAEKLYTESHNMIVLLGNVSNQDETKQRLRKLNKQIADFLEHILDMIEMKNQNNL